MAPKGGTGKTAVATNLAWSLARKGRRVLLVDADVGNPSVRHFLGWDGETRCYLQDYLEQPGQPITRYVYQAANGRNGVLYVSFLSPDVDRMLDFMRSRYPPTALDDAVSAAMEEFGLDVAVIDTPAGLSYDSLVALHAADVVIIVVEPSPASWQGASNLAKLARRVQKELFLVVNLVPENHGDVVREAMGELSIRPIATIGYSPDLHNKLQNGSPVIEEESGSEFARAIGQVSDVVECVLVGG